MRSALLDDEIIQSDIFDFTRAGPEFSTSRSVSPEQKKEIFFSFKKLVLSKNIELIDSQLFEYLIHKYLFSKHENLESFKNDYKGVEGFRRFIIHFIRPNIWDAEYEDLNQVIKNYVFDNLSSILKFLSLNQIKERG